MSMAEVNALPANGYKVASVFSGGGGSCLGYRMAGFNVVWANEFLLHAQQTYKDNAAAHSYMDPRDIKQVLAADVLEKTGLSTGELDVFDGSPPCQAFSTAGKLDKGWGKLKSYENGAKQKNEDLFLEYIRLLNDLQPKMFVAENVSGMVRGVSKGYFLRYLESMKMCGYKVVAKVLDAQWLGVPQRRRRVIFVGVRNDLNGTFQFPKPFAYRYSVKDAIEYAELIVCNGTENVATDLEHTYNETISAEHSRILCRCGWDAGKRRSLDLPCETVLTSGVGPRALAGTYFARAGETMPRRFHTNEIKAVCGYPNDFIFKGTESQICARLGNSVPPLMMLQVAKQLKICLDQINENKTNGTKD